MLASLHLLILLPEVPDRLHQQQLVGFNDLATLLPDIAAEWSEKNLPLKPDEVNAKSRKNVWWRCSKCGNEWKSVINARVKGTVCPVCAEREVLVLLERYGELLINDGMNRFGFGCHESQDEIMLDKYNVVTIYSQQLSNYNEFFEAHGIEKVESLITAWDTFSDETPGQAERCDYEGKSVYDLPEELKDWGMYLADTRAE